jgi:ribosomal-protein-alanine N-acetyltransferase
MRALTCPSIDGGQLRLRPIEYSDIPAWYAYLRLPHVLEHTSWNLASAAELRATVDGFNSDSPSSSLGFAIESVADRKFIGAISFHTVSPVHRTAEIAFNMHPDYWGRGIAARCCNVVANWGFSDQCYVRVQGTAMESNLPSMRVFEKCGFTCEGKLRSFRLVRGQPRDFWMYARTASDGRTATCR